MKNILLLAAGLFLFSCSDETAQKAAKEKEVIPAMSQVSTRGLSDVQVRRGRQLFLKNCTVCHGINGEGAPDWQKRGADGTYPAPPLNGTGHAWHEIDMTAWVIWVLEKTGLIWNVRWAR